ncbi:MAG: CDP-diacylglycerol--glycerol-3-phosphate 3-phosphatidyltransferase [Pseudomonadota bacterium]
MWSSLPNLLTLSRIFAVPFLAAAFFYRDPAGSAVAFALFCAAGITDFFDGYLARAQGTVSKLGQFLDPIADKLMVAAVLILLVWKDSIDGIHILAAVVILCREILVSGLREFLAGTEVSVPVSTLAKWKTTVQMVALGALILAGAVTQEFVHAVGLLCLWVAAVLTLVTGFDYLRAGLREMQ